MTTTPVTKRVTLEIQSGSFETGFPVKLQIEDEHHTAAGVVYSLTAAVVGRLPAAPDLGALYQAWQKSYRNLGQRVRLEHIDEPQTNIAPVHDCRELAVALGDRFNTWLQSRSFHPVTDKWRELLLPKDEIYVLLQSDDLSIQRLPWNLWQLLERYSHAEIALSLPIFDRVESHQRSGPLQILAILGCSEGIQISQDLALLQQLPAQEAQVAVLQEPDRLTLNDKLWEKPWDLLFFAGHSVTLADDGTGRMFINAQESLSIDDIRLAVGRLVGQGLSLAVFNSCDGLGLARALADLRVPQLIVMREPVADMVAQRFLQVLLAAFSTGLPLHQAMRQAREQLQGLEGQFPCATWLPVLCQNPTAKPLVWPKIPPVQPAVRSPWLPWVATPLLSAGLALGLRALGLLQPLELGLYDQMLRWRSAEPPDPRILIVGITEEDLTTLGTSRGSIDDKQLLKALQVLEKGKPRVIGLDLYRPYGAQGPLVQVLKQADRLVAVCKAGDPNDPKNDSIPPPPELVPEQISYVDFLEDADGKLRRQLLSQEPHPASRCKSPYALSTLLAFRYLAQEPKVQPPEFTNQGILQIGPTQFPPLQPGATGGYQRFNAGGTQLLVNYRAGQSGKSLADTLDPVADQITFGDLVGGSFDPAVVKDRVVLIGAIAESRHDFWTTPLGRNPDQRLPGVVVHAHMVSQILSTVLDGRSLLRPAPGWGDGLWVLGWAGVGVGLAAGVRGLEARKAGSKQRLVLVQGGVAVGATIGLLGLSWGLLVGPGLWVAAVPGWVAAAGGWVGVRFWPGRSA